MKPRLLEMAMTGDYEYDKDSGTYRLVQRGGVKRARGDSPNATSRGMAEFQRSMLEAENERRARRPWVIASRMAVVLTLAGGAGYLTTTDIPASWSSSLKALVSRTPVIPSLPGDLASNPALKLLAGQQDAATLNFLRDQEDDKTTAWSGAVPEAMPEATPGVPLQAISSEPITMTRAEAEKQQPWIMHLWSVTSALATECADVPPGEARSSKTGMEVRWHGPEDIAHLRAEADEYMRSMKTLDDGLDTFAGRPRGSLTEFLRLMGAPSPVMNRTAIHQALTKHPGDQDRAVTCAIWTLQADSVVRPRHALRSTGTVTVTE